MARFSEYEIPADHAKVLSGHLSAGDKVPFLTVIDNDRGVAGYAFTPGSPTWVEQFKSDDDVAVEQAKEKAEQDRLAKEENARAARESVDITDTDREPDQSQNGGNGE